MYCAAFDDLTKKTIHLPDNIFHLGHDWGIAGQIEYPHWPVLTAGYETEQFRSSDQ